MLKPGMVVHAFNPSTQEAEAGQPGLQSEFQDSQSYTEKPCLEKTNKQTNKQTNKKERKRKRKEKNEEYFTKVIFY